MRIRIPLMLFVLSTLVVTPAANAAEFGQVAGNPIRVAGGVNDIDPPASISADGLWIAFSSALELTPSAGTGRGGVHAFVQSVADGSYEQIDVLPNGRSTETIQDSTTSGAAPRVSADGRYVAFLSPASDLDPDVEPFSNNTGNDYLYLRDRQTSTTTMVSRRADGTPFAVGGFPPASIDISADGRTLAYEAALNPLSFCGSPGSLAVYTYSVASGTHTLISADGQNCIPEGDSHNPRLSSDGSLVAFDSEAADIGGITATGRNVWTGDFSTGAYQNLTAEADADSRAPAISADGRFVAFETDSGSYDPADTNFRADVYLRDRGNGNTVLVSRLASGSGSGPGASTAPEISDSGRYVIFASENELVGPAEPSEAEDAQTGIYQANLSSGQLTRVDEPPSGELVRRGFLSSPEDIADTGTTVFHSSADNLDAEESRGLFYRLGTDTAPPPPPPADESMLAIQTAISVSGARFTDGRTADYGVLATIDGFADALSGAVLSQRGPLLLSDGDTMDAGSLAEFNRVLGGTGTIYVLGGEAALGAGVASALQQAGYTVVRLSGASRFETSTAIASQARTLFGDTGEVALARAFGPEGNPTAAWADSVTGGGYAAESGTPIVLTPSGEVHPAVQAFLDGDAPGTVHLLGGTAALDASFEQIPGARRTAGASRSDTARQIALQLWEQQEDGRRSYLILDATNEFGWAYGLPAAGLAADANAPILATAGTVNPPETLAAVAGCDGQVLVVRVGPVGPGLMDELDAQDSEAC